MSDQEEVKRQRRTDREYVAIAMYKWVESLFFTFLIVMVLTLIHPILLSVVGAMSSYLLKDRLNRYLRYTVSYMLWVYMLSHYTMIENHVHILYFELVNSLFLFIFAYIIIKFKEGKTIYEK